MKHHNNGGASKLAKVPLYLAALITGGFVAVLTKEFPDMWPITFGTAIIIGIVLWRVAVWIDTPLD